MIRGAIILVVIAAIGIGAWALLRDEGVIEEVTETRVEQALVDNGVPEKMANCMAERLTDKLTYGQLEKLEALAPQGSEEMLPSSPGEAIERFNRVGDDGAVAQLAMTAGRCGLGGLLERIRPGE